MQLNSIKRFEQDYLILRKLVLCKKSNVEYAKSWVKQYGSQASARAVLEVDHYIKNHSKVRLSTETWKDEMMSLKLEEYKDE